LFANAFTELLGKVKTSATGKMRMCIRGCQQIFRIGTVRYAEGLWRMRRHGPVIVHCTDSEDFPNWLRLIQNFR